jgi:hypothetical protein
MGNAAVDITQILVTLISTIGVIVCAVVGKKGGNEKKDPPNKWAIGMWICIALAVINSGVLGWRLLHPSPATDVSITYPINHARIDQNETVHGTSQELPSGQVIWVIVFAQDVGRYYPQDRPADIEAGNKWSSIVYIGIPEDTGKRFDVLVVLADADAQDAFSAYLADSAQRNDWSGLVALPKGAVIYDRITVTRK